MTHAGWGSYVMWNAEICEMKLIISRNILSLFFSSTLFLILDDDTVGVGIDVGILD